MNRREFVAGLLAAAAAPALPLLPTRPPLIMNGFSVGDRVSIVGCEEAGHWLVTAIEHSGDILLRSIDDRP